MTKQVVRVKINGQVREGLAEPRTLLVYFLRSLGLKSSRVGCDTSNCGACTVLMNGLTVKSCTVLAVQAEGTEIRTVEGLSKDGELRPLQEAFTEAHALQCGYCTPGFLLSAFSLLKQNPHPSEEEIRRGLAGNLCMCTGYINIIKAVKLASQRNRVRG